MPIPARPSDTVAFIDLPELSDLLLKLGKVDLRIASGSMVPTLWPGDEIAVEPLPREALRTGDLILFKQHGQLICHRLVEVSTGLLLTRGDATTGTGERISLTQVLGKVVGIRKRTVWVGLKARLQRTVVPPLLRWLPSLQESKAYGVLLRPLAASFLSYHLGVAQGSRWYQWRRLDVTASLPTLEPEARPHLLVAKRGTSVAGWAFLAFKHPTWQCENVSVRIRYHGLGIESALARWAHLLFNAT